MRENELLRLPTNLVDFHRNMIYLKNTKGDINHEIPMNVHTREILRELVGKARAKGYGYIFTNPTTRKPYTTLKTAWDTACKQAGITNLRIRDLRQPLVRGPLTPALHCGRFRKSWVIARAR